VRSRAGHAQRMAGPAGQMPPRARKMPACEANGSAPPRRDRARAKHPRVWGKEARHAGRFLCGLAAARGVESESLGVSFDA